MTTTANNFGKVHRTTDNGETVSCGLQISRSFTIMADDVADVTCSDCHMADIQKWTASRRV